MRYDAICALYPTFPDIMADVAAYVHNDVDQSFVFGYAHNWIDSNVRKEHRQGVMMKIQQFVNAIQGVPQ